MWPAVIEDGVDHIQVFSEKEMFEHFESVGEPVQNPNDPYPVTKECIVIFGHTTFWCNYTSIAQLKQIFRDFEQ